MRLDQYGTYIYLYQRSYLFVRRVPIEDLTLDYLRDNFNSSSTIYVYKVVHNGELEILEKEHALLIGKYNASIR